jgi:hypothetical protein
MVPSIFETTKKRVPEATESRHKCAAESYRSVCRTTSIERPNSKLTAGGGLTVRSTSQKPVYLDLFHEIRTELRPNS